MVSVDDYAGYSKDELVNLCRAKNVSGHSKKKVPELIELLMKAGVVPEAKGPKVADTDNQSTTSTSSASSHEYIFHADWKNVLPYMDAESVELILADPVQSEDWLQECIRILEPTGILLVRGASSTLTATSMTVGGETIQILSKGPVQVPNPPTLTRLYETLISNTRPDSTVLIPFANEKLCSLVRKYRRSFIAMDSDAECVGRLYAILQ